MSFKGEPWKGPELQGVRAMDKDRKFPTDPVDSPPPAGDIETRLQLKLSCSTNWPPASIVDRGFVNRERVQ